MGNPQIKEVLRWKVYCDNWKEGQVAHHLMHLIAWVRDGYEFTENDKAQLMTLENLVVLGVDSDRVRPSLTDGGAANTIGHTNEVRTNA